MRNQSDSRRKTGDGLGEEGNEVAFADGWLLGTLLDEGLVARVVF